MNEGKRKRYVTLSDERCCVRDSRSVGLCLRLGGWSVPWARSGFRTIHVQPVKCNAVVIPYRRPLASGPHTRHSAQVLQTTQSQRYSLSHTACNPLASRHAPRILASAASASSRSTSRDHTRPGARPNSTARDERHPPIPTTDHRIASIGLQPNLLLRVLGHSTCAHPRLKPCSARSAPTPAARDQRMSWMRPGGKDHVQLMKTSCSHAKRCVMP